jgi:hypothetical protein
MTAPGTSALHIRGIVDDVVRDTESQHQRLDTPSPLTDILAMASIVRPNLLRQANPKPAASQRMLSTINRPLAQQMRPAFQRSAIPKSTRIAAFHVPQKILGTANDPTPVPDPSYAHGSYHWSFERCVIRQQSEGDHWMAQIMSLSPRVHK